MLLLPLFPPPFPSCSLPLSLYSSLLPTLLLPPSLRRSLGSTEQQVLPGSTTPPPSLQPPEAIANPQPAHNCQLTKLCSQQESQAGRATGSTEDRQHEGEFLKEKESPIQRARERRQQKRLSLMHSPFSLVFFSHQSRNYLAFESNKS